MKQQTLLFPVRWALNSLGLWIALLLFGTGYENGTVTAGLWGFLLAGLLISAVNALLKPLLVIVSFPAILLTMGLFTLVINGLIVYGSLALAPGISMSFFHSILTGFLLSLLNYIVSTSFEMRRYARVRSV